MKLFRIKITVLIIIWLMAFAPLQAQVWNQIGNAIEGEMANNFFGQSVCLSGNGSVVAVGGRIPPSAYGNGKVRIYEKKGSVWQQIGSDIIGEYRDRFGYSIDLSADGSVAIIGAPSNNENGFYSGKIRIFQDMGNDWNQIANIKGDTLFDEFGHSVSLSADGSVVAIGAPDYYLNMDSGYVRIFKNQGGVWNQIGTTIYGETGGDEFGYSVSLSDDGTVVAIGAPFNNGNGTDAGHVRLFEYQSGTWNQIGSAIEGDTVADYFGTSLCLSANGSVVAIGSPYNSRNGYNAGHVRIFENKNGVWNQIGNAIEGIAAEDFFGASLSLSADGSVVAIGAPENDSFNTNAGHVRIFENHGGSWNQVGNAVEGIAAEDKLGSSVSLNASGSILATGAPENDANGTNAGFVGVFENSTVSRESIQQQSFSFFPNPTTGSFQIKGLTTGSEEIKIEVYDMSGKTVFTKEYNDDSPTVNIANLTPGIYFVKLTAQGQTAVRKVVKL